MKNKLLLTIFFVPMLVIGELIILSIFLGLFLLYALDRIQEGFVALFRAVWPVSNKARADEVVLRATKDHI